MRKVSTKQSRRNRIISQIKKALPPYCHICGLRGTDAAHVLPKSIFFEYYTEGWNICLLCRRCHNEYDGDRDFRKGQRDLFERAYNNVKEEDKGRVLKYFGKI